MPGDPIVLLHGAMTVRAELGMDAFMPLKVRLEDLEQKISDVIDPTKYQIAN
jgi:hypothetical protein